MAILLLSKGPSGPAGAKTRACGVRERAQRAAIAEAIPPASSGGSSDMVGRVGPCVNGVTPRNGKNCTLRFEERRTEVLLMPTFLAIPRLLTPWWNSSLTSAAWLVTVEGLP